MLGEELNVFLRFYFYGLHGIFDEVCFTAVHDLVFEGFDRQLKGHTSLYAFFIYGTCSLFVEWLYLYHLKGKFPLPARSLMYVFVAYFWEFVAGLVLHAFNACPWDYSHKAYHIMGIITLEYAPVWCVAGLYQECLSNFLASLVVKPVNTRKAKDDH